VGLSLYNRGLYNDKFLGVFVISYGIMQLFESLMWLGQNENMKYLNYLGSYLAGIFLHLHPLLLLLGFYLDKKTYPNIEKTTTFKVFLVASVLLALWAVWMNFQTPKSLFYTKPTSDCGHLHWKFPVSGYYIIPFVLIILAIVLMSRPFNLKLLTISYFVIGAILSVIFVTCMSSYASGNGLLSYFKNIINAASVSFGSYWCWFLALFSFILFFVNPFVQPKK